MGLKTTNYLVTDTGETLATAYAYIKKLVRTGQSCEATFAIHRTREKCLEYKALEEKRFAFSLNGFENPWQAAYEKAKEVVVYSYTDPETGEQGTAERRSIFADWEDDILAE